MFINIQFSSTTKLAMLLLSVVYFLSLLVPVLREAVSIVIDEASKWGCLVGTYLVCYSSPSQQESTIETVEV
jgi:hypothetical protein